MKRIWVLIVLALLLAAMAAPLLFFFRQAPVLVVTDAPFAALYGQERLRRQQFAVSRTLFRQVIPVLVADGASPDIVIFAITEAAERPWCVVFPRAQVQAAQRYHEQFPEIPAVLLSGPAPVSGLPAPDGILCVYKTDRGLDLYRAGLFAGILGTAGIEPADQAEDDAIPPEAEGQRTYVLLHDRSTPAAERDLFFRGVREEDPESAIVFANNVSQVPDARRGISCMVLTSAGGSYFENNPKMPMILFSWLNPEFTAREVAVVFDDSPWALVVPAARMAINGEADGAIPSNPVILLEKITDNSTFRLLQESAKKIP